MNDDAFQKRTAAVEAIIDELDAGDMSVEDGEQLFRDGLDLIASAREQLDSGGGRVEYVD